MTAHSCVLSLREGLDLRVSHACRRPSVHTLHSMVILACVVGDSCVCGAELRQRLQCLLTLFTPLMCPADSGRAALAEVQLPSLPIPAGAEGARENRHCEGE